MSWLARARGRTRHSRVHGDTGFLLKKHSEGAVCPPHWASLLQASGGPAAGAHWPGWEAAIPGSLGRSLRLWFSGVEVGVSRELVKHRVLPHPRVVAKIGQMNHTLKMPVSLCWLSRKTRVTSSAVDTYTAQIKGRIQLNLGTQMMWAWYVTSYYSQLVAGCCSQWSWEKGTDHPERDTHCLSGQPVPSPPLMDGSVLTIIWHRWRHWSLDVYSRCPIPPQRLENTSVVTAGIKALACFFQCVMAMKCGNHYRKFGQPRSIEVCRRRRMRWHKQSSARMCSRC